VDLFAGLLGVLLGVVVLAALLAGLFMWIGAKLARVPGATFGKAILAGIASAFASWLMTAVFSVVPVIGTLVGFLAGLLLSAFVIQAVFDTSLEKALLVWVFHLLAEILVIVIALATFAGGLLSYLAG